MLKLERKSKRSEVSVSIKDCGRLLTPSFLYALGIAFAIHLFGVILFQISPFKIGHVETIFPPIQVNVDYLPLIDSGVLAELENEPSVMPPIPEPKMSTPKIYGMLLIEPKKYIVNPKITNVLNFHSNKLEAWNDYSDIISLEAPFPEKTKPLTIHLFGQLTEKEYTLGNFDPKESLPKITQDLGYKKVAVSYRVKIEDREGKIFWYQQITSPEKKKTGKFAEKVLMAMQFEKIADGFISEGEVEIEFLEENQ